MYDVVGCIVGRGAASSGRGNDSTEVGGILGKGNSWGRALVSTASCGVEEATGERSNKDDVKLRLRLSCLEASVG